jgi:hypothetical protein
MTVVVHITDCDKDVFAVKLLFKKRYESQHVQVNGSSTDELAKNFSILFKYIEGRVINIGISVNIHGLSSGNLVLVCMSV